jgi:DNA-binding transcriptional LysR family regulator
LIERPAGRLTFALYAAQSYLDRRLPSASGDDFGRQDFIGYDRPLQKTAPAQRLLAQGARRFAFRCNSDYALEEAALQGQGICVLARAQGRTLSGLVELRTEMALPTIPVYLVFHKELRQVLRYRAVVAALQSALRQALA